MPDLSVPHAAAVSDPAVSCPTLPSPSHRKPLAHLFLFVVWDKDINMPQLLADIKTLGGTLCRDVRDERITHILLPRCRDGRVYRVTFRPGTPGTNSHKHLDNILLRICPIHIGGGRTLFPATFAKIRPVDLGWLHVAAKGYLGSCTIWCENTTLPSDLSVFPPYSTERSVPIPVLDFIPLDVQLWFQSKSSLSLDKTTCSPKLEASRSGDTLDTEGGPSPCETTAVVHLEPVPLGVKQEVGMESPASSLAVSTTGTWREEGNTKERGTACEKMKGDPDDDPKPLQDVSTSARRRLRSSSDGLPASDPVAITSNHRFRAASAPI